MALSVEENILRCLRKVAETAPGAQRSRAWRPPQRREPPARPVEVKEAESAKDG